MLLFYMTGCPKRKRKKLPYVFLSFSRENWSERCFHEETHLSSQHFHRRKLFPMVCLFASAPSPQEESKQLATKRETQRNRSSSVAALRRERHHQGHHEESRSAAPRAPLHALHARLGPALLCCCWQGTPSRILEIDRSPLSSLQFLENRFGHLFSLHSVAANSVEVMPCAQ
jgi:hypothetical protein